MSSSPQPFVSSSSPGRFATSRYGKSRFTFRQLSLLGQSSTTCPLRVIAHIDLDAFYAQCEMVRLNLPEDQPLAVQQWQGLIAINYPARAYGLSRHINISEAKKLCPNLVMQHVATWKEGDTMWAYHPDAFSHMATHKVSLDPYRLESRKILALIKEMLPPSPIQRVEKASIDEVFLDLSAQVHEMLLEKYPELRGPPPYDDPTENLPFPPTTALDWKADALVDLDPSETEDDDPDWDDIAMLMGSEICRSVRAVIRERLKYTCSAGIARNKMLAKLGSGHKKPNSQTVIRNRAAQQFLRNVKFTKIRNLGGKLGDQVVSTFGTDEVAELLKVPAEQLRAKIGDDTGSWLYNIVRGEEYGEVNPRTVIKSMLSAKSFRPSINTYDSAVKWLRIFCADIFARLVEEGVCSNKRRPRTITLHHRTGSQTRSRQMPIPMGCPIDESMLFDLAKNLLGQVMLEGTAFPCSNISLSVGGFEEGVTGNRGITSFLVKGEEVKAMNSHHSPRGTDQIEQSRPEKRRKTEDSGIQRYFARQENMGESDEAFNTDSPRLDETLPLEGSVGGSRETRDTVSNHVDVDQVMGLPRGEEADGDNNNSDTFSDPKHHDFHQTSITSYFCEECRMNMPIEEQEEHHDWHFAKSLQEEERSQPPHAGDHQQLSRDLSRPAGASRGLGRGKKQNGGNKDGGKKTEKGQKTLTFGR